MQPPKSVTYKGRPHISLDALTDVCYAAASRNESAMRIMLKHALFEYSGKDMQWHEEYLEAVVSDVLDFVEDDKGRVSRRRESEDGPFSG